jgi:hypothetical protein
VSSLSTHRVRPGDSFLEIRNAYHTPYDDNRVRRPGDYCLDARSLQLRRLFGINGGRYCDGSVE